MTGIGQPDPGGSVPAATPRIDEPITAAAAPTGSAQARRPRPLAWLVAIAGALVLPVLVAAGLTLTASGPGHLDDADHAHAADARVVSAADMEREHGIRFDLVAVTADGGLVDVRFTVVDKAKAEHILHDAAALPELLVEPSGAVLRAPQPHAHKLDLVDGGVYFLLFPNSGGVIQTGTPVSVVIDAIRLEAVDAQG